MKKMMTIALLAIFATASLAAAAGWWLDTGAGDYGITLGGRIFDQTAWSEVRGAGTDLGELANLDITDASFHYWFSSVPEYAEDPSGLNFFFKIYNSEGTIVSGGDAGRDIHMGTGSYVATTQHDYAFSGPVVNDSKSILAEGVTLNPGDTYGIEMWAKIYSTGGGDQYINGTGDNLHAYFKYQPAAPVPEPATMSLLGLGALAMLIRRKLRK